MDEVFGFLEFPWSRGSSPRRYDCAVLSFLRAMVDLKDLKGGCVRLISTVNVISEPSSGGIQSYTENR